MQTLTKIGPSIPVGLAGCASAIFHLPEKLLEQRSLLRRKRGHLLNQFCCAHAVNLVQPGSLANDDFSLAQRGAAWQLGLRRGQGVGLVDEVAESALQGQGFGDAGAGGLDGAGVGASKEVAT